jgi:hypothetical protein
MMSFQGSCRILAHQTWRQEAPDVSQEKSKLGLGKQFTNLCSQLDALSYYHFVLHLVANKAKMQNRKVVPPCNNCDQAGQNMPKRRTYWLDSE